MSGCLFLYLILSYLSAVHTGDSLMPHVPIVWAKASFLGMGEGDRVTHKGWVITWLWNFAKEKTEGMCQRLLISFLLFSCEHLHRLSLNTSCQPSGTSEWPLTYLSLTACFWPGANEARPGREPRWRGDFCEGWGDLGYSWGLALWDLESSSPLYPEDYWK